MAVRRGKRGERRLAAGGAGTVRAGGNMAKFDRKLGTILTRAGILTEEQREQAIADAEKENSSLTKVLVARNILSERDVLGAVAAEMGIPPIDLEKVQFQPEALEKLDREKAASYQVLPIARIGKTLTLAMANPSDVLVIDDLHVSTGCDIVPVVSTDLAIAKAIERAYKSQEAEEATETQQADLEKMFEETAAEEVEIKEGGEKEEEEGIVDLTQVKSEDSPLVKMVNLLILQGIQQGASDIHIEPYEKKVRVRYRIDGTCHETVSPPKSLHPAIVSRIKIMSNMDISESRRPQDGKFQMLVSGRQVDFRVCTLPMVFGEKVCIRILDTSNLALTLDSLGFEPEALADFRWAVNQPYGMILATGPTGCGKSTTLYSAPVSYTHL
ncbi:MAG: ATPase, T2SS/T4P/T4SS family, partial [Planctomycetota bacterium]|nr:ATPase, T2SS/T4P/T4SS family [Planctomycetota bacterium]